MEKETIMRYVERARNEYFKINNQPARYREENALEIAAAKLIQIECLALELGYIEKGTI